MRMINMTQKFRLSHMRSGLYGLFVLMLCLSLSAIALTYPGTSHAADDKNEKSKAPLISKKVYDRLTIAQEYVNKQQYNEAIGILDDIKESRRLNSTEVTQLWNFYAYIYFSQDRYKEAISAYSTLLEQPNLQLGIQTSTLYTLSQLYFLTENYRKALEKIEQWMALSEAPSPDAYALLGQAHYKLEQFKEAIPALSKAIELRKAEAKPVKENWYLLLRAVHYELKDYKSMANVLKELITLYPKEQYFRDLAGAYSQLGDTRKQLGVMETMYDKGFLTKESQLKNLATLFLMHEVPYKAAKVLQKAIDDGILQQNEKNLTLLSQAWVQAREDKQAIEPLKAAARISSEGEPWIKLGRAYVNLDQWPEAVQSLKTGLQKPGVKREDAAYILLGMGYYNLKQLEQARNAFTRAAGVSDSDRNKKAATQWIAYLESEIERETALAQK